MLAIPFTFSIVMQVEQYRLKQTAIQRFHQQNSICIRLPLPTGKDLEAGDEVALDGKMYDIEKIVQQHGATLVYAWPDTEEDAIKAALYSLTTQQREGKHNKDTAQKVLQFFMMPFLHPMPLQMGYTGPIITVAYAGLAVHFTTVFLAVATPPPLT